MAVTLANFAKYRNALSKVNAKAADEFRDAILKAPGGLSAISNDELVDLAYAVVTKYGEAASELACQLHDTVAALDGAYVAAAEPAETATMAEVAKAVNGTRQNQNMVTGAVQRLVKRAAEDTTMQNAIRDGAEFAWIPSGDTCAFCLTLASRGWQYASKKAMKNGHAEHVHAHCDCTYAIRFNGKTNIKGYDPEKLREEYENADGIKPKDKINAMRRIHYEENKEQINAQKRALYELNKENESSDS